MLFRRPIILLALLLVCAFGCTTRRSDIPRHPSLLEYEPLEFAAPEPDVVTLPNGLAVYLLEDRQLPLVTISAKVRVGSIHEPADRIGLAGICGEVMRTGGTRTWSGSEVDEKLEFISALLGNSIGLESGEASLDVRLRDLEEAFPVFAEMLRYPRFEEDKIAIARQMRLEGIRRRNDRPSNIAGREFRRLLYGTQSPWARITQPDTIHAVSRDDLIAFHARYYHPNNIALGVTGDFDRDMILAMIEEHFGGWPRKETAFDELEPVDRKVEPALYTITRDVPQSTVIIGHFGYRRLDPAQLPLTLFNEIFGTGGFSSRLVREVRSNRGLAYSTYGHISRGTDVGSFVMFAETRAESVGECIQVMLDEMRKAVNEPFAEEEVERARESETNRFIFAFTSAEDIVSLRMDLDFFDYPSDWLTNYVERLRDISPQTISDAARRFLDPDRMIVLVVGNTSSYIDALSALGYGQPIEVPLDPVE